ncbi:MAG: FG-GAP repeat protein [Cyclobacteriaceae bacterium]|nr:FG-GAP repeat protein [Cyclobacteriaceae bacterium]
MNRRFCYWIKLQRKYRNLQQRFARSGERKLQRKLEAIAHRIIRLNKKWRLGLATSLLTGWLTWSPATVNAQGPVLPLKYNLNELSATDGFLITGDLEYSSMVVETVGDLNGDGVNDLAVGQYFRQDYYITTRVYVVFGQLNGFTTPPNLTTLAPSEGFSIDVPARINAIANAGDVNNDGMEDLIMGSMYAEDKRGHVYVIFGSASIADMDVADLDGTNGFTILGNNTTAGNFGLGDRIGNAVSGNGDVNNDGIDDLAFGGYTYLGFRGASFVVFGQSTWPATLTAADIGSGNGFKVFGTINNSVDSGASVDISGDFNGDGIEDLLIGEAGTFYGGVRRGTVWIMLGKETGLDGIINIGQATHFIRPSAANPQFRDRFSENMTYIPDFNGDGINDVLIAAPTESSPNEAYVVVLFGGIQGTGNYNIDNLDGTNGFFIEHSNLERVGDVISTGDFNGDGLSDVVVSNSDGPTSIIFGSTNPMEPRIDLNNLKAGQGTTIYGQNVFLGSVSLKGDITGDSLDDLLISENRYGNVYLLFGKTAPEQPTPVNPIPAQNAVEGSPFNFTVPPGIFASQDLNLTFSVTGENDEPLPAWLSYDVETKTLSGTPGNGDEGTINLKVTVTDTQGNSAFTTLNISVLDEKAFISGSTLTDLQDRVIRIDGTGDFFSFGNGVIGIGDINGDGNEDILTSAPNADLGGINNSGAAIVVFGNANGPSSPFDVASIDGTNGFIIPGTTPFQYAGNSINKAGDFNGDHREDFVVSDNDVSYVIFGADTYPHPFDLSSLDGTNGFKVQHSSRDISNSLKPVGDVNGDGFDDLITGAGSYPATTLLVFGNASNDATLDLESPAPGSTISFQSYYGVLAAGGIGDVNGDGLDDLAITGYYGETHIIFGSTGLPATVDLGNTILDGSNGFIVQPQNSYNSVASRAGDLNADGIDDFLINSLSGNGGEGMIVVFGSSSGFPAVLNDSDINGDNGFWFVNPDFNYYSFGSVVAGNGDFNHDGFNDLTVGDGNTLWVIISRQGEFDEVLTTAEFTAVDGFTLNLEDYYVSSISVTDFNGDGLSDIVFGDDYERKVFLIKGNGPIAPVVANPIADVNVNEDQELSFTIPTTTFSDANPNDELSLSITYEGSGAAPAWVNIDQGNATLTGTPLNDSDAGTFPFRVTATDEDGLTASVDFNVVVTAVNDAPVLGAIGNKVVDTGKELTFTATATDADLPANTLTFSLDPASLGKGMVIDGATGAFSWTPTPADEGNHDVSVTVSDGSLSDSETFTVTVVGPLGLEVEEKVSISPNPVKDFLTVKSGVPLYAQVVGLDGRVHEAATTDERIDMRDLPAGIYVVRLSDGKGVQSVHRIVKY